MTRPTLVPEIYVSNIAKSLKFYIDVLGFQIEYQRTESGFASIRLENGWLMLEQYASTQSATPKEFAAGHWRTAPFEAPLGRGINFEFTISDLASVLGKVHKAEYQLKLEPYEKSYRVNDTLKRVRQFLIQDPDGYLIRIAEDISEK